MEETPFNVEPTGDPLEPIVSRRRGRPRKAPASAPRAATEESETTSIPKVVKRDELLAIVVSSMSLLSGLLDESFNVLGPDGKPLPHVEMAVSQMLPWAEIYAEKFLKISPWLGLAAGCTMLLGNAVEPTVQIAMGVRKPRFMRATPEDVYTDRYKPAAEQTVDMPQANGGMATNG